METTGHLLPRSELLQRVEHREAIARTLDLAERAMKTWEVVCSDFLSPPELAEAMAIFEPLAEVETVAWGGYPQAERQRLAIAPPSMLIASPGDDPQALAKAVVELAAIEVRGNFLFDTATHRDFLGSILATGIVREKVGDILAVGEQGAQIVLEPQLVPHLEMSLTQVRSVPVKTKQISIEALRVRPPRTKSITTVEASMRLDAIASAGFSTSRSRMAGDIQTGEVKVNWKTITQASRPVATGDLIAIRGRGRVQVGEVSTTKKGRYRVELTRYL
ncbi:photosystem II S4 domain protein [Synechococcus sp. PCC 7336]|uniref:photosystem II S4 domain protein n=1 Tax=Synechococcus sp. PCC 7336 TaxID=195250 RepID=UPI0003757F4E|nr:photosystem II S4 domain protein [Synechococcus sp. PCC 7336]